MITVWLLVLAAALSEPAVQFEVDQFRTASVDTRRRTMLEVAQHAKQAGASLLPIIDAGLRDEDRRVAFSASSALTTMVARALEVTPEASALRDEISAYAPLAAVIAATMDHPDFRVRAGTIGAIRVLGPAPQENLLPQLIDHLTIETEPRVRALGIEVLGLLAANSPSAVATIVGALQDSAPVVRRSAALAVAKFKSRAALPVIVQELERGIVETRAEFVFALAAYGAAARPYVGLLERLLAMETREDRRRQIRGAIAAIQKP